jgi:hypothetical protein
MRIPREWKQLPALGLYSCLVQGKPTMCHRDAAPGDQRGLLSCPPMPTHPPAQPSSASVSRSSRPFRFSALMMVGRGARSTSCLSGRTGRVKPNLLSFLVREKSKGDELTSVRMEAESNTSKSKLYTPDWCLR